MLTKIVLALSILALVRAQVPSLGFCPEYVPMANFDMSRFLGVWYEAERYFQLTEVVSRCVTSNYTRGPDGKYRVSNEVTNRFTGVKRILEGEIKKSASKAEEGKLHVKYTIPLTPETKYSVLETDYDTYAVLWSCSGLGPFHTQNAWLMTRERIAPGPVIQKAYGVLDKYKISKTFFVKTDQDDCAYLENAPVKATTEKPVEVPVALQQQASSAPYEEDEGSYRQALQPEEPLGEPLASADVLNVKKAEAMPETVAEVAKQTETVPERILKIADAMKHEKLMDDVKEEKIVEEKKDEMKSSDVKMENVLSTKGMKETA